MGGGGLGGGISALAVGALGQLWISLILCVSFATYGLLRKIAPVDAVAGLAIETAILFPFAAGWLIWGLAAGTPIFGTSQLHVVLIAFAGIVTATPLLLFTAAAKRLRYSTLGMLQFLAPTLQFLLAVSIYGEPFTTAHAIAFGAIWGALRSLRPRHRPPCASVRRLARVRNMEQCRPLLWL